MDLNILTETIEFQDYLEHGHITSLNAVIIVALISATIQIWGLIMQNIRIWKNEQASSLPLFFFVFQFFYCIAYLIYGFKINSGALIINNLVGLAFIPIIIGLVKNTLHEKKSLRLELYFSILFFSVIPIVLLVEKELSLIIVLFLAIAVYIQLVVQLYRSGRLRHLEPKYAFSIILSSLIWLFYGWRIGDYGIFFSSATTVLGGSMFFVFLKLRPKRLDANLE